MQTDKRKCCAYCGKVLGKDRTREHVFPQGLYAPSRRSLYTPLTVPACRACNGSWSDAEEHFRNVVALAGDANEAVSDLFGSKVRRGLDRPEGQGRIRDLLAITETVHVDDKRRLKIYPARAPRVLEVIRKIVIGLCYHHCLETALNPKRVWADVLRYAVPAAFLEEMTTEHCEAEIVQYKYLVMPEQGIHSVWIFLFFERTPFIATVSMSQDGSFPLEDEA